MFSLTDELHFTSKWKYDLQNFLLYLNTSFKKKLLFYKLWWISKIYDCEKIKNLAVKFLASSSKQHEEPPWAATEVDSVD